MGFLNSPGDAAGSALPHFWLHIWNSALQPFLLVHDGLVLLSAAILGGGHHLPPSPATIPLVLGHPPAWSEGWCCPKQPLTVTHNTVLWIFFPYLIIFWLGHSLSSPGEASHAGALQSPSFLSLLVLKPSLFFLSEVVG